jgi:hypothetical protein
MPRLMGRQVACITNGFCIRCGERISKEETPCFVCPNNTLCFSFQICSPSMLWLVAPPWSPPQQQQLETPPTVLSINHHACLIRRMPGIPRRLHDRTLLIHDCHGRWISDRISKVRSYNWCRMPAKFVDEQITCPIINWQADFHLKERNNLKQRSRPLYSLLV